MTSLLPATSQPYEIAAEQGISFDLEVPIVEALSIDNSAPEMLPFLAGHESVDLWFSDWSESRKRAMVREALELAGLVGCLPALVRFLGFVDAEIVDRIASPQRFVLGRSAIGRHPVTFAPFTGRYLIKTHRKRHVRAMVLGRSATNINALVPTDRTAIERAEKAGRVAKNPSTQYTFDHGHRRRIRFGDAVPLDGTYKVGDFIDRQKL